MNFLILLVEIQIALSIGYLVFAQTKTNRHLTAQMRLRIGQFTLTAAMLAPVVLFWLPVQSLKLSTHLPDPISEVSAWVQTAPTVHKPASPTLSPVPPRTAAEGLPFSPLNIIFAIAGAYLLWRGVLLGLRIKALRVLLRRTTVLHRRNRVRVALSKDWAVPFSTAIDGYRWVVLPYALVTNRLHFRIALRHEFQHHRNGDTVFSLALEVLGLFLDFNPFFRIWKREIAELQEFSCDESIVGRRGISSHDYGNCLVRVAEAALGNRSLQTGTTCMASISGNPKHFKTFLQRRIEMLFQSAKARPNGLAAWVLGGLLVSLTTGVAFGAHVALKPSVFSKTPKPNAGTLTVDPVVQEMSEKLLRNELKRLHATSGFAVVGDPETGRVIAVANIDKTATKRDSKHWALGMRVNAASTMKAFVTAAAIEQGVTSPSEKHSCENGTYQVAGQTFKDWTKFRTLTTAETVAQSSNICGIKIAQKLGAEKLTAALHDFGFGAGGVTSGFPEAVEGAVISPAAGLQEQFVATVGTGYEGAQLSPLEVLQAMAAIANGGTLYQPIAADAPESAVRPIRRVLSKETAASMREILRGVVQSGTAKNIDHGLYALAGKTSSAHGQKGDGPSSEAPSMAGFAGFAPASQPRIVAYVGIFAPKGGDDQAHGSVHAAPLFKEIVETVLQQKGVPADPL